MVAAHQPSIAALVLLAGPAWDGRRVLVYQNAWLLKKKLAGSALDSAMVEAKQGIDSLAAADPWFGFFVAHDPLPVARKLSKPRVLLLQGETDRQVSAEQVDELAAAFKASGNRDVTVHKLPATNHLFLHDPSGDPSGYALVPSGQVPRETLGLIADWLVARLTPAAQVRPGAPSRGSASRSPRP
jgi:fermentation-respiration switch protein FrsA (DUF1100 family)